MQQEYKDDAIGADFQAYMDALQANPAASPFNSSMGGPDVYDPEGNQSDTPSPEASLGGDPAPAAAVQMGQAERPAERVQTQTPSAGLAQAPNPDAPMGGMFGAAPEPPSVQTPKPPSSPTPVGAGGMDSFSPEPFTPLSTLRPPSAQSLVSPLGQGSLLGSAGGLQGGGLGAPGSSSGTGDNILPMLLQMLATRADR